MTDYDLTSFDATQEQKDALGGDDSQIKYIKVWDPFNAAGWIVVGLGTLSAQVVCPKPCGSFS
jgi:hypothetical protein